MLKLFVVDFDTGQTIAVDATEHGEGAGTYSVVAKKLLSWCRGKRL